MSQIADDLPPVSHPSPSPEGSVADESGSGSPGAICQGSEMNAPAPDARWSEAMQLVRRFHQALGLPSASRPTIDIPADLAKLRVDLLVEEVGEFADASAARDMVGVADALADIVYLAYGAAVTYGIDLDASLRKVHRANMSKLDEHGKPLYREDGKVLKSAQYTSPDVSRLLPVQPPLPF